MPPLALLLLAAQVGGPVPGAVPSTGRYAAQCTAVRVIASDREASPKDMTFSSRETLDLLFLPRVRQDLRGEHLMQLKGFTPGGFLYQVITVPFVGGARPGGTTNRAAGSGGPPPPRGAAGFPPPAAEA